MAIYQGAAKRLDSIDIPRIASTIDCGEDELRAFMEVEAGGRGFDSQGRVKALFEPHKFYANLSGAKRDLAVKRGLAYPKWGQKKYPKDSYPRILSAMAIDETAALKSISWGLGQIMGENYGMLGYDSPQAMVAAFAADEEHHLEGIVQFLVKSGIDDDLRAHRWAVVARVYNGPGYVKNKYDVNLEKAYKKWAKIPDVVWTTTATPKPVVVMLGRNSKGVYVKRVQTALGIRIDGDYGAKTEGAVKKFQLLHKLAPDGKVGPKTWEVLIGNAA